MRSSYIRLSITFFLTFSQAIILAQDWEFAKEKDGIKVYTRHEQVSNFKSFKGETEIRANVSQVCELIEDVQSFDRWDEDVSEIRLLDREPGKTLKYYVVYDVPWPFNDRDLCVEAVISDDPSSGARVINAKSCPESVPLDDKLMRIVNYWQRWTVQPGENGMVHITLEGFADPAGDIPAWIVNLAITDTPFNILRSIKESLK